MVVACVIGASCSRPLRSADVPRGFTGTFAHQRAADQYRAPAPRMPRIPLVCPGRIGQSVLYCLPTLGRVRQGRGQMGRKRFAVVVLGVLAAAQLVTVA